MVLLQIKPKDYGCYKFRQAWLYVFVLASSLSASLDVLGCVLSCSFVGQAVILVVGWADLLIGVIFQDVDLTWPGQRIPRIPDFVCVCARVCVWNEWWSGARKADTGLFVLCCSELQAVLTAI